MNTRKIKHILEEKQIFIYLASIILAIFLSFLNTNKEFFGISINWLLGFMLFVTFLQIPILNIIDSFKNIKFIIILLLSNFLIIPIFVFLLFLFLPNNDILKLGILLVLLMPCVDYVITFSNLANANSKILLISTPILLLAQIALLPFYLNIFLKNNFSNIINFYDFFNAFLYLIIFPFIFAFILQILKKKYNYLKLIVSYLEILPVVLTGIVLFVIVLYIFPQLLNAYYIIVYAVIIYIIFSIVSPIIGYNIGKLFKLSLENKKTLAFSCATRNSLIILPIALAIPNSYPIIPAVIVLQTFIEICFEIVYVKVFKNIKP